VYVGVDFLVAPDLRPFVVEVNIGLPGGAEEYDRTCLVHDGRASGVFRTIEEVSLQAYGRSFRDYLESLPWLSSLKALKLWMDGQGAFPGSVHPALRLEDKWVQYKVLSPIVPMPETIVCGPEAGPDAERLLGRKKRLVAKRRLGRGGRDLRLIDGPGDLPAGPAGEYGCLLQERIESRLGPYAFSLRSVAFGGRPICLYANMAARPFSNHGILAYVESGDRLGLSGDPAQTRPFDGRSWEAKIWFGDNEPAYLRHNLYEDDVAEAALTVPAGLLEAIKAMSVRIERTYERLDLDGLPPALFEEPAAGIRRP
jgi:hypothetical protein